MNLDSTLARRMRVVAAAAALLLPASLAACANQHAAAAGSQTVSQSDATGPAGNGSPAGGRHHMAEALMSVGLSDDQKAKIRGIMSDVRNQNKTTNPDPETRRANYRAAFAKIDAIMTPDQRAKFKAKMAELRAQQPPGNS